MSTDAERDTATDRLLKAVLRAGDRPAGPGCLDAERLAAWDDGVIYGQEATDIEAHLADCARCQALLAAFARTAPPDAAPIPMEAPEQPAAPLPFRPRQPPRWFIPAAIGAAAAMLLIWTAVRPPAGVVEPVDTIAKTEPAAPAASAVTVPPAATFEAAPRPPQPVDRPAAEAARSTAAPTPLPIPAPGSPLPGAATAGALRPAPAARADAAAAPKLADARMASQPVESVEITFSSPPVRPGRTGAGAVGNARGAAQAAAQPVRWLIAASGKVLRSLSGGATWETLALDPNATITGGVAPSANVCWLIGRAGVVMRAEDGLTFARVTFPEAVDLRSITAADDQEATVTTMDGRAYKTNDGGATWHKGL